MTGSAKSLFIPVCCVCGLAREDGQAVGSSEETWSDFDGYVDRHELRGADYKLTHGYCPTCAQVVTAKKKTMMAEDGREPDDGAGITEVIMETLRSGMPYELDALIRSCPQYSWNQIFLEVDRLSRNGDILLTTSARGRYTICLAEPTVSREEAAQHMPAHR